MTNELAKQDTADVVPFQPQPGAISPMVQMIASGQMPVEQVEQMLALQERYEANEARKAYYAAMSAARADLPVIGKSRNNDFLKTKYADLDAMIAGAGPVLAKHGLSFSFEYDQSVERQVTTNCIVHHSMGHVVRVPVNMPVMEPIRSRDGKNATNPAQMVGIAMTYGRRYAFAAAFGIATGDDTDAQVPDTPLFVEQITDAQESELVALIDACNEAKDGSGDRWRKAQIAKHGAADRPLGFTIPETWFEKAKESLTARLAGIKAEQAGGGDDA